MVTERKRDVQCESALTLQTDMLHRFTVWCSVGKLEDLAVDAGIILKGILRKQRGETVD